MLQFLLRTKTTFIIIGLILFSESLFLFQKYTQFSFSDFLSSITTNALAELTNRHRQEKLLAQLTPNQKLAQAAQWKAEDMAAKGYFAHISPEGVAPWYWIDKADYRFGCAGENLAVNFIDSKDVTDAWMNSPSHRENILNNNFTEIGIGMAQGSYQGQKTTFVVQMFGRPGPKETNGVSLAPIQNNAPSAQADAITQPLVEATKITIKENKLPGPEKILANPRQSASHLYFGLLSIFGAAGLENILLARLPARQARRKAFFPDSRRLLLNCLSVIVILILFLWANHYLAFSQARIF